MLLYHLFVTFQVLYSVSGYITCYDCPFDENSFDYFVTNDRIPEKLNNCGIKTTGDTCIIDIVWNRNPDKTQIRLAGRDDEKSLFTEHTLITNVNLENKGSEFIWTRSTSYMCSTDRCNSWTQFKRLLDSLTLNDNFHELEYLLKPEEPFDGTWCKFESNTTSLECASAIPSASCKECSFQGISDYGSLEICANCLIDEIGETFLSHEVNFDMTNRTRADHWMLECRSNDCNTINNGDLIRQKSTSNFDFVKFLDDSNKSTILSSVSKMALLSIVFIIKRLN